VLCFNSTVAHTV